MMVITNERVERASLSASHYTSVSDTGLHRMTALLAFEEKPGVMKSPFTETAPLSP